MVVLPSNVGGFNIGTGRLSDRLRGCLRNVPARWPNPSLETVRPSSNSPLCRPGGRRQVTDDTTIGTEETDAGNGLAGVVLLSTCSVEKGLWRKD